MLATLQERADAHDHFEFWTFPHADIALTRTHDRTDEAPRGPSRARAYVERHPARQPRLWVVSRVARRFPSTIPRLNRFAARAASSASASTGRTPIFASQRLVRFEEMEYSVPREQAAAAVARLKAILERHPVSFPIELRFSARRRRAAVSGPRSRQRVSWRARLRGNGRTSAPFREVEAALSALEGRPHWGKRSFLGATRARPAYPRWDAFQRVRRELDPDGRFANAWVRHVLG